MGEAQQDQYVAGGDGVAAAGPAAGHDRPTVVAFQGRRELGLNADAEVIRRLDDIRKADTIMDSMEDLEKAAKAAGDEL